MNARTNTANDAAPRRYCEDCIFHTIRDRMAGPWEFHEDYCNRHLCIDPSPCEDYTENEN